MILKEESQLLQNIKLGHLYRVYLLYGEEKYLKEMYRKSWLSLPLQKTLRNLTFISLTETNFLWTA